MPFPDLPPERIPGSPGHLNDHQLIDQALDYIQQAGYRDDPNFPPLPDVPVLGQSGHVTAHDRILAILEYVKANPPGMTWAQVSNTPTGTYKDSDGHTYAYYEFTTSGTLTVTTAGYLDVFVLGGGGKYGPLGGTYIGQVRGSGGQLAEGVHLFQATAYDVTVGAGATSKSSESGAMGGTSRIGDVVFAAGGGWSNRETKTGKYSGTGYETTFTGSSFTVGASGGQHSSTGWGDGGKENANGKPGVVIVKTRLN